MNLTYESCMSRLAELFPYPSLLELFQSIGTIAGGSVVYAINSNVPKESVGDIDVWVTSQRDFRRVCMAMDRRFECRYFVYPHEGPVMCGKCAMSNQYAMSNECKECDRLTMKGRISIVNIRTSDNTDVQVILTKLTPQATIENFDMDYVQCAVHNGEVYTTEMCREAHATMTVNYIKRPRFYRLQKAKTKGFRVPLMYEDDGYLFPEKVLLNRKYVFERRVKYDTGIYEDRFLNKYKLDSLKPITDCMWDSYKRSCVQRLYFITSSNMFDCVWARVNILDVKEKILQFDDITRYTVEIEKQHALKAIDSFDLSKYYFYPSIMSARGDHLVCFRVYRGRCTKYSRAKIVCMMPYNNRYILPEIDVLRCRWMKRMKMGQRFSTYIYYERLRLAHYLLSKEDEEYKDEEKAKKRCYEEFLRKHSKTVGYIEKIVYDTIEYLKEGMCKARGERVPSLQLLTLMSIHRKPTVKNMVRIIEAC